MIEAAGLVIKKVMMMKVSVYLYPRSLARAAWNNPYPPSIRVGIDCRSALYDMIDIVLQQGQPLLHQNRDGADRSVRPIQEDRDLPLSIYRSPRHAFQASFSMMRMAITVAMS